LGIATLDDYHSFTIGLTMPSSPRTPKHSRHPSNIDLSFAMPSYGNDSSPRRYSKTSIHSPTTPQRNSLNRSDSIGIDVFSSGGPAAASNGLGNLADELADAWDDGEGEDDDEEPEMNFQEGAEEGGVTRDSGVDVASSPVQAESKPTNLTPHTITRGHRREPSEYDGSDYGGDSDLDSPGIPPGLQLRMDMVESLARRGTENNGTDRDGVVNRVIEGLKDLGGQSGVEGGATRFVTLASLSQYKSNIAKTYYSTYCIIVTSSSPDTIATISSIPTIFSFVTTTR
jgi:hypothetical protein